MFNGIKFMPSDDLLQVNNIEMLKFYTVDSNILMGIVSFILAIYEYLLLKKKIDKIPNFVYLFKMIGTASIFLTFIVTAFFLTPRYGLYSMYNNSNLIFHLIVPLLSVFSYTFYEKHDNRLKYAVLGIIPMVLYSIYYTTEILVHLDSEGLTYKYDFYGFLAGKLSNLFISVPIVYLVTFGLSLFIVSMNKKFAK